MEHYFSPSPKSPGLDSSGNRRSVTLRLKDLTVELRTGRGVFSAGRVDPGTLLLLKHAPLPPPPAGNGNGTTGGRVLVDVGCGYGPIAVTLALRAPDANLWAVDVNERARQLTEANLAAAGVTVTVGAAPRPGGAPAARATVCGPHQVPETLRVDAFYCNPPVRIGKAALDGLLAGWIERLRPGGFAVLVMHKNLGADSLARRLAAAGRTPQRLAVGGGYRVMRVPASGTGQ